MPKNNFSAILLRKQVEFGKMMMMSTLY